jgi:hypothetical protein
MKIHEALKDITTGGILFLCLKTYCMEGNTQKYEDTCDYAHKRTLMLPGHAARRLEYLPYTLSMDF